MKLKLYAIHDQAVNEFIGPEVSRTHGEAERKFRDHVNNPEAGLLNKHPQQFTLFYLGEYESENGSLTGLKEGPQSMINGVQAKDQPT